MKRRLLLHLLLALLGASTAGAQDAPQPVFFELDVDGLGLSEALSRAADVAGFDLAYAPELVVGKTSGCVIRTPSVTALLHCVLEGTGLEARRLEGGAFLIQRAPEAVQVRPAGLRATGVIRGTVHAGATREGIVGAHVLVRGTLLGDATDARGAYLIDRVPEGNHVLVVSSIGYDAATRDRVTVAPGDTVEVPIGLAERAMVLDELTVVAGYDRFTHRVARQIPVALQSVHVYGMGLGLLVSANPGAVTRMQVSGFGNLAGSDLKGVQLSAGVNYTGGRAYGLQAGALGNRVGTHLDGLQAAGVFNGAQGRVRGLQAAGASNAAWSTVDGLQAAGALNVAADDLRGLQAAGALNVAGDLSGVQAAGAVNLSAHAAGAQVGGAVNLARSVRGLQAAGAVNLARSVRGMQLGIVNLARSVRGMQIGVVNIAGRSTGVPIGLFNYVREAGLGLDVWTDETGMVTTAVRTGNRRVATFLGFAGRPWEEMHRWGVLFGMGIERDLSRRLFVAGDVLSYSMGFIDVDEEAYEHLMKARLVLHARLGARLGLFAGPAYSMFVGDADGRDLAPWTHLDGPIGNQRYRTWPGFVAGVRVRG